MYLILGIVTQGLVSFAAARANVLQDGEHCVTSSQVAAKETTYEGTDPSESLTLFLYS